MKRLLCVIFMVLVILGGCGDKEAAKTEEQLKAEIRAELEAEAKLKEEVAAELKAEQEENEQKQQTVYIIDGYVMPSYLPYGDGIRFNDTITIKREFDEGEDRIIECNEIYIKDRNGINMYDYIDKKHIVFSDPLLTVAEDSKIRIKAKVDISEFLEIRDQYTDDAVTGYLVEIIELDGSDELIDMTDTKYPLQTYKDLFSMLIYSARLQEDGFCPKDVKEFKLYNNQESEEGRLFKETVDAILDSGLYINMGEGEYYIEKEKKSYNE